MRAFMDACTSFRKGNMHQETKKPSTSGTVIQIRQNLSDTLVKAYCFAHHPVLNGIKHRSVSFCSVAESFRITPDAANSIV